MNSAHIVKHSGHSTEATRLHNTCHRAELVWREVPDPVLRWLLDPASLTRCIQTSCLGYFRAEQPEAIRGRHSLFTFGGEPLVVSEIFLPAIPPCP